MSGRVYGFSSVRSLLGHFSLQAAVVAAALFSGTLCASSQTAPAFNPSRANAGTLGVISGELTAPISGSRPTSPMCSTGMTFVCCR
ncbi:hypothetical protein ACFQY9_03335 [Microvirga aerilata]|uniref:hypothetical protein n=1 Tax=Microvirga aerilata TaxID=670292 RepID=UPI003637DB9C